MAKVTVNTYYCDSCGADITKKGSILDTKLTIHKGQVLEKNSQWDHLCIECYETILNSVKAIITGYTKKE